LPERRGKGAAVRAGIAAALERALAPDAILVIDADGQHPPSAIPAFLAAGSEPDLVIGDRFHHLAAMPWARRIALRDPVEPSDRLVNTCSRTLSESETRWRTGAAKRCGGRS
jgi:glycosyltransferase involved in cell wall biosynthesis